MEFKVLVINESTAKSIITDTYTFACFIGCLFLNHYFLGSAAVLEVFICSILILSVWARGKKLRKEMTPAEALKYLTDNKAVEQTGESCASASNSDKSEATT